MHLANSFLQKIHNQSCGLYMKKGGGKKDHERKHKDPSGVRGGKKKHHTCTHEDKACAYVR